MGEGTAFEALEESKLVHYIAVWTTNTLDIGHFVKKFGFFIRKIRVFYKGEKKRIFRSGAKNLKKASFFR